MSAIFSALLLQAGYNTALVCVGAALLGAAAGAVGALVMLRRRSLATDAAGHATLPGLDVPARQLEAACHRVARALQWLDARRAEDPDAVGAAAYDVLSALGILYVGWNWLEILAAVSQPQALRHADPDTVQIKRALESIWRERQLPLVDALCQRIESGNLGLMAIPDELV